MKPNSKKINDIVVQIFNKDALTPGYPYLITSYNMNKTYTGTLSEIDDENHKLIFRIYDDNGELKTACISMLGICQGLYTIEKPLPIDLNASDNEEVEEEEEEPEELDDEEQEEAKPNGPKIYTRSIVYHDTRNNINERYVTTEENDLSEFFCFGCESDDSILIKQFAYKVSYIDKGNIVKYEIFSSLAIDENSKVPEGFRVHPMFWDKENNKFKYNIRISKNVEHFGQTDLSMSWTIQIASGLQMLYFIEHGLNSITHCDGYHGIHSFIKPANYQYISNAKVDVSGALVIDDEETHILLPTASGFVYSFYQDVSHNYDWLFIPYAIVDSNIGHSERFCDSYYVSPRENQKCQLSYGGPHDKDCEPYGPFTIAACDYDGFRHFDIASRTIIK